MAALDIGIDLGTSTIIASNSSRGIVIKEPSIVAVNNHTGEIIGIGKTALDMVGRTPSHIDLIRPLADGVISDFGMTGLLIRHLMKRICRNHLIKPQVIVCIPSGITAVESQAVINATLDAGARKVYLVEEPVAAAIGAGMDISRPSGNMVIDIGGGTSDIAVLSFNGIVYKNSVKVAGQRFDEAIVRYIRSTYNLDIGMKTAEALKIEIGSVANEPEERTAYAKGRHLIDGLPKKLDISRSELRPVLAETVWDIVQAAQNVLEHTPPELVGDIRTNGIMLTGGGCLLHGLDELVSYGTNAPAVRAQNPVECVAVGTAKSFAYLDVLYDGITSPKTLFK